MSDDIDVQMAKMHQEVATHNSELALKKVTLSRDELMERIERLDGVVANLQFEVQHLQQKYNLLLSKNFNTGPTVVE